MKTVFGEQTGRRQGIKSSNIVQRKEGNTIKCVHYKSSVLNQFLWIDEMDQLKIYNSTKRSCIIWVALKTYLKKEFQTIRDESIVRVRDDGDCQ